MSATSKALKIYAKGVVTAAKSWSNLKDGVNDDASPSEVLTMLDTYIATLEDSEASAVLGKFNYGKYINQIEKLREKFVKKYGDGESFTTASAKIDDDGDLVFSADAGNAYVYAADDAAPADPADLAAISLVGVVAE